MKGCGSLGGLLLTGWLVFSRGGGGGGGGRDPRCGSPAGSRRFQEGDGGSLLSGAMLWQGGDEGRMRVT